ncbi:hypothetical protein GGQ73_004393 [Rhizobium skierniewicense]|uniref:Uncharacterized protein n=1 Tax=Rhizobium skierniewicense TaxID=984260 RepID=A0A7W6CJT8_9HYPH|nr:hypothetical protein [Rhizobium skierniewicense]MBB3948406.1 hypothetical protein [Rhizobium skierniewicense]
MDTLAILALATQCVTAAPAPIVAAVAMAETSGSTYSVTVDGKRSDHAEQNEAVQSVALALVEGATVKVGLAGVPVKSFDSLKVSYTEGFSSCFNLEVAGDELRKRWESFGGQEDHWRLAALDYGTGEPGVDSDYSKRFDAALAEINELSHRLGKRQGQASKVVAAGPASSSDEEAPNSPPAQQAAVPENKWDVFNNQRSQSLLIFSR